MDEAHDLLKAIRHGESVRDGVSAHEVRRSGGVCWSGLAPAPSRRLDEDELQQAASERLASRARWAASPEGRFLLAIAAAQRAAAEVEAAGERARAAVARDFFTEAERCTEAAAELAACTRRLAAAVRAARSALRT